MKELRLYDRSRVTTDWTCPRMRFLNYELEGKGIVPSLSAFPLWMGTTLHDGLSAIARDHLLPCTGPETNGLKWEGAQPLGIDLIASTAEAQMRESLLANSSGVQEEVDFAFEQGALVEGILRGFYRHVWPRLIQEYPLILHIEEEMEFSHDGLLFMSKPDLVLAKEDRSEIVYVEYKSTSSKKEGWINSWETAVQLHSTIKAIEATCHEKVDKVIVQGLFKGGESYGKQNSPFCYLYERKGQPPFSKDEVLYSYRGGFKRTPVWERAGGVRAWVQEMPEDVLADQFPQAPPIFVKDELVSSFFRQRAWREKEIGLALDMLEGLEGEEGRGLLDVAFPQRFDKCREPWGEGGKGRKCDYLRICHGGVEGVSEGTPAAGFEWRVPHHLPEEERWRENGGLEDNSGHPLEDRLPKVEGDGPEGSLQTLVR